MKNRIYDESDNEEHDRLTDKLIIIKIYTEELRYEGLRTSRTDYRADE